MTETKEVFIFPKLDSSHLSQKFEIKLSTDIKNLLCFRNLSGHCRNNHRVETFCASVSPFLYHVKSKPHV